MRKHRSALQCVHVGQSAPACTQHGQQRPFPRRTANEAHTYAPEVAYIESQRPCPVQGQQRRLRGVSFAGYGAGQRNLPSLPCFGLRAARSGVGRASQRDGQLRQATVLAALASAGLDEVA